MKTTCKTKKTSKMKMTCKWRWPQKKECLKNDGQARTGPVRTGQVRTGKVRTVQVRTGQVRTSLVRTGWAKTIQDRLQIQIPIPEEKLVSCFGIGLNLGYRYRYDQISNIGIGRKWNPDIVIVMIEKFWCRYGYHTNIKVLVWLLVSVENVWYRYRCQYRHESQAGRQGCKNVMIFLTPETTP